MHRNSKQPERETRRSILIVGASAILVAGTAAALPLLRKPARDAKTNCLAATLARKSMVLIDRTDAWSSSTAILLTATLKRIAGSAANEERLQLIPFDGSAAILPEPLFDRCKPPASGNVIIETPQRLAKVHAEQFAAPLVAALDRLTKPASAPRTELVQMIAILAAKSRLEMSAELTTLHVFSDMEENSAAFSFTRKPAQHLDRFASHFASTIGERLKDIAVHIHVMPPANPSLQADPRIERAWRAALARHSIQYSWEPL